MRNQLLYNTEYIACSDWCLRHLGNENVGKNIDSHFIHPINKSLNEINIIVKVTMDKINEYDITRFLRIIENKIGDLIITSHRNGIDILLNNGSIPYHLDNEDWFYKIEIYGEL